MTTYQIKTSSVYNLRKALKTKQPAKIKYRVEKELKKREKENNRWADKFLKSKIFKLTVAQALRKGECEIVKVWGVPIIYAYPLEPMKFWDSLSEIVNNASDKEMMKTLEADNDFQPCVLI